MSTVYTGLLVEEIDGIPMVRPESEDGLSVWSRFMVDDLEEEDDCRCHEVDPELLAAGLVCSGKEFRWYAGDPAPRFDRPFTPPYVSEVRCG